MTLREITQIACTAAVVVQPLACSTIAHAQSSLGSFAATSQQPLESQAKQGSRKSPALAAAISLLIPGTGLMYVGKWGMGLLSFGTHVLSAYTATAFGGTEGYLGWGAVIISSAFLAYHEAREYNQARGFSLSASPSVAVAPRRVMPKVHSEPLCFATWGFSLHAATPIEAADREKLERLCRYAIQPPLATGRF